ncbi:MAG: hypothetical protein QF511_13545, partial [Rhodospirillales bacterium]|nr:hypothetical protein [Rhodospirillales bacterium]
PLSIVIFMVIRRSWLPQSTTEKIVFPVALNYLNTRFKTPDRGQFLFARAEFRVTNLPPMKISVGIPYSLESP